MFNKSVIYLCRLDQQNMSMRRWYGIYYLIKTMVWLKMYETTPILFHTGILWMWARAKLYILMPVAYFHIMTQISTFDTWVGSPSHELIYDFWIN